MSGARPGSPRWWQDTALIAVGGVALAVLLWDGPIEFYTTWVPELDQTPKDDASDPIGERPVTGCYRPADGDAPAGAVYCIIATPDTPDTAPEGPPERRLFP